MLSYDLGLFVAPVLNICEVNSGISSVTTRAASVGWGREGGGIRSFFGKTTLHETIIKNYMTSVEIMFIVFSIICKY